MVRGRHGVGMDSLLLGLFFIFWVGFETFVFTRSKEIKKFYEKKSVM